jgi:predicted DNA-binding transcriptional regulator AlpA
MTEMALQSTGLGREERTGASVGVDIVRTIKETARILGVGEPTLRTMIAEGRGPTVTRLSYRRIGIRDSHRQHWLDSKAQAQPA